LKNRLWPHLKQKSVPELAKAQRKLAHSRNTQKNVSKTKRSSLDQTLPAPEEFLEPASGVNVSI
jgi:hypothetical protein